MKKILLGLAIITLISCTKEVPTTQLIETNNVKKTSSVQCSGTTQNGSRCKNKTLSANGKCYLHGGN